MAVEVLSPWGLLDDAPAIPAALLVTAAAVDASARCDDRDAAWMESRDPSGAMRRRLDDVGALDDGCVDLGDTAAAMAAEMSDRGLSAEVVRLANPDGATGPEGSTHVEVFGSADLARLADAVVGLTR